MKKKVEEDQVTTGSVAVTPTPFLKKPEDGEEGEYTLDYPHTGANWKMFTVRAETFRKFDTGRNKFERWSRYLDLKDEEEKAVYDYASRNRKKTVVLKCSTTGALRAIRRVTK